VLLFVVVWGAACGGQIVGGGDGGAPGNNGDGGSDGAEAGFPLCPTIEPKAGIVCYQAGQVCIYLSSVCRSWECQSMTWHPSDAGCP
jgi:hypothetical protein